MLRVAGHGQVTEIALDRPPANALNLALVCQLHAAHAESCAGGARAIVLTGRPGLFSAGLDVPGLLPQDRPAILAFWRAFFDLTRALVTSPVPVVVAISGHAPAGGAVLAVHCDYRVAARGPFQVGLNEVAVGLPVPASIMTAYGDLIGARRAHILAMSGRLLSMEEALQAGLVDELAEPDRLMAQALGVAQRLADLPPIAMNRTRLLSRAGLVQAMDPAAEAAAATEYWFSSETQAGMRALAARLAKK